MVWHDSCNSIGVILKDKTMKTIIIIGVIIGHTTLALIGMGLISGDLQDLITDTKKSIKRKFSRVSH